MSTVVDAMIYVYDPKQLDRHFGKRWAYAHMRPALPRALQQG